MKKNILLFSLLIFNLAVCQTKKLPKLEDKRVETYFDNPEYFKEQLNNEETSELFAFYRLVYEFTTTKNSKLKSHTDVNSFPWDYKVTNLEAEQILTNISKSIHAEKNSYEETDEIKFISKNVLKFTNKEVEEFTAKGYLRTKKPNILRNIKCTFLDYSLKNEYGKKVNIEQQYLGLCSQGRSKKDKNYYHGFCMFNQSLKPEYKELYGFIDIELKIPIDYEIKKITKKDIDKIFYIGKNKIKVLEFDANTFHCQIIEKAEDFETILNTNNMGELRIPLNCYKKLRENQGWSFDEMIKNKHFFEMIKKNIKDYNADIYIFKSDDFLLDFVYFYTPKYISKKVRVKIDIK